MASLSELREMSNEQMDGCPAKRPAQTLFRLRIQAQTDRLDVPSELATKPKTGRAESRRFSGNVKSRRNERTKPRPAPITDLSHPTSIVSDEPLKLFRPKRSRWDTEMPKRILTGRVKSDKMDEDASRRDCAIRSAPQVRKNSIVIERPVTCTMKTTNQGRRHGSDH